MGMKWHQRVSNWIGLIGSLATVAFLVACEGQPTATPLPQQATEPPIGASIQRHLAAVQTGAEQSLTLSELSDDQPHDLADRDRVATDQDGEGWLDIQNCLLIYLFQESGLLKASCPKASAETGNVTCVQQGMAAFNNSCGERVVIQTDSAQVILNGTWLAVGYLKAQHLTLVIVLDGSAGVQPVLNSVTGGSGGLGASINVPAQYFLYTTPDDVPLSPIPGLTPRQPLPLNLLPALIQQFSLEGWIDRIKDRARNKDGVPFPDFPAATDTPVSGSAVLPTETELPAFTDTPARPTDILTDIPTDTPTYTPTIFFYPTDTPTDTPTSTYTPAVGSSVACVDFEQLPLGTVYHVQGQFTESGITMVGLPFNWGNGTATADGQAIVRSGARAGGSGQDLRLDNISIETDFATTATSLTLRFGEYGGNINIKVNGQFRNFNSFDSVGSTNIGDVPVRSNIYNPRSKNGSGDLGVLSLTGQIKTFAIGGQELWIDHMCVAR